MRAEVRPGWIGSVNVIGASMLGGEKDGWVGIDLGGTSAKVAQVRQTPKGDRVAAACRIPLGEPLDAEAIAAGQLDSFDAAIEQLRRQWPRFEHLFRGRPAAIALPHAVTERRTFKFPAASRDELAMMASEELALESPDGTVPHFGFWSTSLPDPAQVELTVLATRREVSSRLAETLWQMSLDPMLFDAQVCAAARAASHPQSDEAAFCLDLGHDCATLVVSRLGEPAGVRTLRGCGAGTLVGATASRLQLNCSQAFELLTRVGLAAEGEGGSTAARRLQDCIAEPLQRLTQSLQSTIYYFGRRAELRSIRRVVLTGAAAAIPGLDRLLASRLGKDVRAWGEPAGGGALPGSGLAEGELAVAVAMSNACRVEAACTST